MTPLLDSRNRYTVLDSLVRDSRALDAPCTPLGTASSRETCGSMGARLSTASFPCQNKKITILKQPTAVHKETNKFFVRTLNIKKEIMLEVGLETLDLHKKMKGTALLDSGATGMFMSLRFVTQHGFQMWKLDRPIQVRNMDGTVNSAGSITHEVDLIMYYQGHKESTTFDICILGQLDIIIGTPWLQCHNPKIDWNTGKVKMTQCPQTCRGRRKEIRDACRWRKAD